MKVYLNRKPRFGAYGGGNMFTTAFCKRARQYCDFLEGQTFNINPDVVLLAGLDNDGTGLSIDQAVMHQLYFAHDMKIVLRVNECDARKGTRDVDDKWLKVSKHVDGTVFVSRWLQDYFNDKGWACPVQTVIHNGCAADVFKSQPKLNNGKTNVVVAHWSDNPMKGKDVNDWLDDFVGRHPTDYAFTYVGRTQSQFKHSTHVKPIYGSALAQELGKHDVCINATRFDPGPNSVIEPITCGLPTFVHHDGGGAVEFAGEDHVFNNVTDLEKLLLSKHFAPNTTKFAPWLDTIKSYVDFLAQVHALPARASDD